MKKLIPALIAAVLAVLIISAEADATDPATLWSDEPAPFCGSVLAEAEGLNVPCVDPANAVAVNRHGFDCPVGLSPWRLAGNSWNYNDAVTNSIGAADYAVESTYGAWSNWCVPEVSEDDSFDDPNPQPHACDTGIPKVGETTEGVPICASARTDLCDPAERLFGVTADKKLPVCLPAAPVPGFTG